MKVFTAIIILILGIFLWLETNEEKKLRRQISEINKIIIEDVNEALPKERLISVNGKYMYARNAEEAIILMKKLQREAGGFEEIKTMSWAVPIVDGDIISAFRQVNTPDFSGAQERLLIK